MPTIFSVFSTLILIGAVLWNYLVQLNEFWIKMTIAISCCLMKFISIITLTVLNALDSGNLELKSQDIHDYGLRPGTRDDIEAMIQILSIFSSLYNWIITFLYVILVINFIFELRYQRLWNKLTKNPKNEKNENSNDLKLKEMKK